MSKNSHQPATAAQIYARHERKQAILAEIAEVRESIGGTHAKISHLEQERRQAYTEEKRMERDLESARKEKREVASLEARLEKHKAGLAATESAYEEAVHEGAHLAAVLDKLEREDLPICQQTTTAEEVLAHQAAILGFEQEAASLDEAIQTQHRLIQEIRDEVPVLADRSAERCELLALVAINQAPQGRVEELDEKIKAERDEHERVLDQAKAIISQAEQTIAGLESMRADVLNRVGSLKTLSSFVMEQYLRSEMDTIACAYVEKAREITELFIQLHGVNMLIYGVCGQDPKLIGPQELSIPGFNIKACRDTFTGRMAGGHLFRGEIEGHRAMAWQKTMAAQRARLRNLGINLI